MKLIALYIYILLLFLYFFSFLRIDSKRECSRRIETIQAYYDIFVRSGTNGYGRDSDPKSIQIYEKYRDWIQSNNNNNNNNKTITKNMEEHHTRNVVL